MILYPYLGLEELGYKLKKDEIEQIYQKFLQVADKKKEVFDDDLLALVDKEVVATPKTYELFYLSVLTESHKDPKVTLKVKLKGKVLTASGTGSGPVDAAYKLIDKLLNRKTRLLDYQIHSVTVGKDAQGEVTVKVAGENEKVIIGQGLSTDVIEASVKAYLNAINKIDHRTQGSKKGRRAYGV